MLLVSVANQCAALPPPPLLLPLAITVVMFVAVFIVVAQGAVVSASAVAVATALSNLQEMLLSLFPIARKQLSHHQGEVFLLAVLQPVEAATAIPTT